MLTPFGACANEQQTEAELVLPPIPPAPVRESSSLPAEPTPGTAYVPAQTNSQTIENYEYITYHSNTGISRDELDSRIRALGAALRTEYLTQTQGLLAQAVDREFFSKQVDRIFEAIDDDTDGESTTVTSFDNATLDSVTLSSAVVISDLATNTVLYVNDAQELTASSRLFITNNNLAIGTSTAYEALTVNSPIYVGSSVPTSTTNRLYNTDGTLYWNGSILAGATSGQWDSNGTDVYRATGNVGIGSSTPSSRLTVIGSGYFGGNLIATGTLSVTGLTNLATTTIASSTITTLTLVNALAAESGGTGLSTITQNQLLIGSAGNTWTQLATSSLGIAISDTIGTLAVNRGGTGATTLTGLLQGNGTGTITAVSGTVGQIPYFNGTSTLAATSSIYVASNGNIGIGTTAASSRLTVLGNIYATGNISASGSFVSTGQSSLATTTISSSTITTLTLNNALSALSGGTGFNTYSTGDMIYSTGVDTLGKRTIGTTGDVLSVIGGVPTWTATSTLGFASAFTTSAQLANLLNDETGSVGGGLAVFSNAPTFTGVSTFAGVSTTNATTSNLVITSLTSGRIPFVNTDGRLIDSANFTVNNNIINAGVDIVPLVTVGSNIGSTTRRFANAWAGTLNVGTTTTWSIFTNADGRLSVTDAALQGGTERFSLGTNGNVGIGSSTPSSLLTVASSTANGTSRLFSISTSSELFTVLANGNVAIGTTTPTSNARLTVAGGGVDANQPTNPTLIGTFNTSGTAVGVSVVGSYAYVADDSAGLQVIDISNPASPSVTGNLVTGAGASNVTVVGRNAYVATGATLEIIDISNPTRPIAVGSVNVGAFGRDVSVVGRYAYVADDSAGLQIINISNPATPSITGTVDTSGTAYGVAIAGRYAYIADSSSGLQIIDISNPTNPTVTGTLSTTDARGVSIVGNYAYIADSASGLRIVNISSSTNPTLTGTFNTSGNANDIAVVGNYAYVADNSSGLQIINISNPASPTLASTLDTSGSAWGISLGGRYAYVADFTSGLQIIDINGSNFSSLFAGALGATDANFAQNLIVGNNGSFSGGLDIGHDARVGGALTVTGTASSTLLGGNSDASLLVSTGNLGIMSGGIRIGTTTNIATAASVVPRLQISGTNASNGSIGLSVYSTGNAPIYALNRSRGADIGVNGVVQNGDNFGNLYFTGDDGSQFRAGAIISGEVDGVPGASDMPGRLTFNTTADGNGSPAERMRISSNGNIGIGTTSSSSRLTVDGTTLLAGTLTGLSWATFGSGADPVTGRGDGDIVGGTSSSTLHYDASNAVTYLQAGGVFANGPSLVGRRSRGTVSSPTAVATGDTLLSMRGFGYNATTSPSFDEAARIDIDSEGTIGAFVPGIIKFYTQNATGGLLERLAIDSDGEVTIKGGDLVSPSLKTLSARSAIVNDSVLGGFDIMSADTNLGTIGSTTASIRGVGTQTHTASALGSRLEFLVTADSTVTPVTAMTINQNSRVGIGTTSPVSLLSVSGTLTVTATSSMAAIGSSVLLGGATTLSTDANGQIIRTPSDQRLKTNVTTIENALETVLQLRGVQYDWVDTDRFGDETEIGFLAQEVDQVLPQVVRKGGEYWSLNTPNIVAVVVEAIKEIWADMTTIKADVSNLKEENERLKNRLEALELHQSASVQQSNSTPPPSTDTTTPTEPANNTVNEPAPATGEEPAPPTEPAPAADTLPASTEPPVPEAPAPQTPE